MRTCQRCHSENFHDVKFCNFCGTSMPRAVGGSLFDDGPEYVIGSAVPAPEPTLQSNPQEAYRYFMHGRTKLAAGDVAAAIGLFQKALDSDPGDPNVRKLLDRAIRLRQRAASHLAHQDKPVSLSTDTVRTPPKPVELFPNAAEVLSPGGLYRVSSSAVQKPKRAIQASSKKSSLKLITPVRGGASEMSGIQLRSKWHEALPVTPGYRPADLLDSAPDGDMKELAVSLLLALGMFAFMYLLVF